MEKRTAILLVPNEFMAFVHASFMQKVFYNSQ